MSEPDDDAPQFRVDHLRPVDHAIARAIMGETWQQSALAAGWLPPNASEWLLTLRTEFDRELAALRNIEASRHGLTVSGRALRRL